ncbi:T9SS type B sorting domain-containing protein [Tenacibaculum maritimum]|uniref:T9SS type B sorting domain-containing protein n=1 Tax=Tenacibaculum maritimum TaxID=107401 RepID=UPI0038764142
MKTCILFSQNTTDYTLFNHTLGITPIFTDQNNTIQPATNYKRIHDFLTGYIFENAQRITLNKSSTTSNKTKYTTYMKKIKLLTLLLISVTLNTFSQGHEVTVGNPICGTSITKNAPANYDYLLDKKNSWTTMLYTASRINTSGAIKGIAFFTDCVVTSNCAFDEAKHQKIYLKEIEETQFNATNEPDLSTYTLVYDGKITWRRGQGNVENSKTQIIFQNSFQYSGNKNLAIYFLNENNNALGGFLGCGSSPPFLWDYAGEKTIVREFFKQGEKSGSGTFDTTLPIIRFYFDALNTDDFTPSPQTTQITATPTEILANGVSSSKITVQLYNEKGGTLNHSGQRIELNTTAGSLGTVTDNNNGTYTTLLTSGTLIEVATISGILNGTNISDTAEVKFIDKNTPIDPIDPVDPINPVFNSNIVQGFSPNGDGKNDTWKIMPNVFNNYPNNSLQVFNRQGNLVFQAAPYKNNWDGISTGKITISKETKLPIGPYYFVFNTGTNKTHKGWVYINY